jgi:hypothetical protein
LLADQIRYVRESGEDILFSFLVLLAGGLLMFELTALFSTPIPDSYLWWGDESWLMLEFKSQIMTGVFRHPFALASTLEHGSGAIFSNMWITALLYGGAAAIFKSANIIIVGRAITALLSTGLVFALYEMVRKLTNERLQAIFAVILLITTRSFFFTSHSARYDILSACAICIGFFLTLRIRVDSPKRAFLCGLSIAAGLLISVHVMLLLLLAGVVAVLIDSRRTLMSLLVFAGGVCCVLLLLFSLSSLLGRTGNSINSGFALNIHDIPALRIYSRSVQYANIAQRFATLSSLALGFLISTVVAILAFLIKCIHAKRIHVARGLWLTVAALLGWLEFESAAPTSYLIYILPVLSIAIAIAIQPLFPKKVAIICVTIATLTLTFFALHDDWRARSNGKKLSQANDEAVSAALASISQDTTHPVVLAFNPAVQRVAMDSSVRLMTTHFIEYPATSDRVDSVIRQQHVKYVMLYRSAQKADYMREVQPITDASKRLGVLVWERPGFLTDIGRSYFVKDFNGEDTLQIYRIRD